MASQQYRYIVIMIIVLLTIYIYVIYSTNEMEVPGRIHTSQPMIQISNFGISEALTGQDFKNNLNGNGTSNLNINNPNNISNRSNINNYTINNNSDNRIILEESKLSFPDTINSSLHQEGEVVFPDINSNINNDLLTKSDAAVELKSSLVENSPAKNDENKMPNSNKGAVKSTTNSNTNNTKLLTKSSKTLNNNNNSSTVSQNNKINTSLSPNNTTVKHNPVTLDASKGVRTSQFYESGHLESNSEICPELGGPIQLLILITSAPSHSEARLAIRQTWGHFGTRRDVSIAFVLGSTGNPLIEEQLDSENYMYGDLIRGRFIDSYNNLTLKTISLLEWTDKYCPKASFILKTDDDMFINVPKLLKFTEKHSKDTRTIYGRLAKKWKPIRNVKSKYYVSVKQYPPTVFPQFTTGPAYLITSDCIKNLYEKSLNQTYLKLEDVYTTGIVAQLVNIKRVHVIEFLNRRVAFKTCNIKKAITVHMVKSNEQFDLWKKLLEKDTKCK